MDINQIDNTFSTLCNKKLSGALSPDERNQIYYLVNADLFSYHAGLSQDYEFGKPLSKAGFQVTFRNSDDVKDFIIIRDISKDADNTFHYPVDYAAMDYMLFGYIDGGCDDTTLRWKRIEQVTGGERAIRLDSSLIPPTFDYPISAYTRTGWIINPETIVSIRLSYLKFPVAPVWGYTVTNDQQIFDPATSVNSEWSDTLFGDFVLRACRYAGFNLDQQELINNSLTRVVSGQ